MNDEPEIHCATIGMVSCHSQIREMSSRALEIDVKRGLPGSKHLASIMVSNCCRIRGLLRLSITILHLKTIWGDRICEFEGRCLSIPKAGPPVATLSASDDTYGEVLNHPHYV